MKINHFLLKDVQLVQKDDEAFASVYMNPWLTLIKFILTDDKPNGNNMKIPKEEFSNLITSGLYMPIKMAEGEIKDGHDDAVPIGVITHLKEDSDKVRGLAALWNKERPEDVNLIRQRYAENKPLDVSWEVGYQDSMFNDEGIEVLLNTVLRAATLVGIPAYAGRTIITQVANKHKEEDLDELKTLKELTESQKSELENKSSTIESLEAKVKELEENQITSEIEDELSTLREWKKEAEAEAELETKKEAIREKFEDADVEKDEEYFDENFSMLLSLEDDILDFVIKQVAAADKAESKEEKASKKKPVIPNFSADDDLDDLSPKTLAQKIKEAEKSEKE
jgi:hypothetical protein